MASDRKSCPCRDLPLCLSSFTAAEYGDLHVLAKHGQALADRRDNFGYSPLHLAAQNGNVSATSLLLQLGCHVDGKNGCGATPLHRASFSGAVATMRLLLDWDSPPCDLLAKDTSFGDCMTPLHKAASGGRYMAVQLLLQALRNPKVHHISSLSVDLSTSSLLHAGLGALDSLGRTPSQVARELRINEKRERESVARWDEVAGCEADWEKCLTLLEAAEEEISQNDSHSVKVRPGHNGNLFQNLPTHLKPGSSCIDCGAGDGGRCLTSSWEKAFQAALGNSVELSLKRSMKHLSNDATNEISLSDAPDKYSPKKTKKSSSHGQDKNSPMLQNQSSQIGHCCAACQKHCISLHQGPSGVLLCKKCKRSATKGN